MSSNVLLISADSLRTDRLALWNPAGGVSTPHLERFAAEGTRFSQAWAVTPWTAPSMVSAFTGLYPPSHGVAYRDDTTPEGLMTLPRVLEGAGYRLGNFSFFSGISYFRNLGFPEPSPELQHGDEASALASWLDEGEGPFFAWVHLLQPHLPYGASGYRAREVTVAGSSGLESAQLNATVPVGTVEFAAGDRQRLVELYDRDLADLDEALGSILAVLEERGLAEDTLVVFVADHGEELLEYGWVGHASTAMAAKLVPEILRIPLILRGPGVPRGEVERALVQHVDVLPTVLSLLDIESPGPVDGRVLIGARRSRWPWLRRERRKWVYFDSSLGGNLTPPERRGERMQGVSDGRCLLSSHSGLGEERIEMQPLGETSCLEAPLRAALGGWREDQGRRRLELLQGVADLAGPDSKLVDTFAEALEVIAPGTGEVLDWRQLSGQLVIEWAGASPSYWLEYDVGSAPLKVRGAFKVEQTRLVFGPFPQGFWNDLAGYSPFRFRVVDEERRQRSSWRHFEIRAVGGI